MKIFIGSSKEEIELVRHIQTWLEELEIISLPWDEPGLFFPGTNTFHRLIEISRQVEGAIFIFSEDDKVWYRNDSVSQPRDNVLVEYGLFCGSIGPQKAIILKNGSPKSASDLLGINYIDASIQTRNRAKLQIRMWCQQLLKERNEKALKEKEEQRQAITTTHNIMFEEFRNNIIYNFNKYRNNINNSLLEVLKKVEKSNTDIHEYPEHLKAKMKEYLLFFEYFGSLLKQVNIEDLIIEDIDFFALGMAAYLDSKFEEAKQFFEKSFEMNRNNYLTIFRLGTINYSLDNYKDAIKCYDISTSINPNFAPNYYNKGIAYMKLGQYGEAAIEFSTAIEKNSAYVAAYNNLATAYICDKKFNEANKALDQLLSIDNTYFNAYYNKACLFSEQKNKAQTLHCLSKAINFAPSLSQIAQKDPSFEWLFGNPEFVKTLNP